MLSCPFQQKFGLKNIYNKSDYCSMAIWLLICRYVFQSFHCHMTHLLVFVHLSHWKAPFLHHSRLHFFHLVFCFIRHSKACPQKDCTFCTSLLKCWLPCRNKHCLLSQSLFCVLLFHLGIQYKFLWTISPSSDLSLKITLDVCKPQTLPPLSQKDPGETL